ncbi:hypothetical protein HY412_00960 [Candidatus Kaiserbacteria bacterium]|nr:hypothetical protein [Candidatus Kaiserbacteria bacterium]
MVRVVLNAEELAAIKKIHFQKIPTAKEYGNDPDSVFLEFVPTWWQYTDYNTKPETRISSQAR